MKKLLWASVFAVAGATPGFAADAVYSDPIIDAPVSAYNWSGFYIGAQVGYGWGDGEIVEGPFENFGSGTVEGDFLANTDPDGFLGGVTGGYNWQFGNFVVGLEGSISASGMNDEPAFGPGLESELDVNWIATVGPRLGYAMDRTLLYVEGGYAAADIDLEVVSGGDPFSDSNVHDGGFVGLGVEHAFTDNMRIGFEYNYIRLEDAGYSDVPPAFGAETGVDLEDLDIHTVGVRAVFNF